MRGIGVNIFGGYCSGWMDSVALLSFRLFYRQRDFFCMRWWVVFAFFTKNLVVCFYFSCGILGFVKSEEDRKFYNFFAKVIA